MKNFEETESIDIEKINLQKLQNENTVKVDKVTIEPDVLDLYKSMNSENNKTLNNSDIKDLVKNDFQEKTMVVEKVDNLNCIGIASDHRGFRLKQKLTKYLNKKGYSVIDYGTDSRESTDYPVYGFKLGKAVKNHEVAKGIAICGSGIGISIACNKIKGVRCAKVNDTKEAKWARIDNDANIIALSAKMPMFRVKDVIDVFLKTNFSNLQRHKKRIDMLDSYEE